VIPVFLEAVAEQRVGHTQVLAFVRAEVVRADEVVDLDQIGYLQAIEIGIEFRNVQGVIRCEVDAERVAAQVIIAVGGVDKQRVAGDDAGVGVVEVGGAIREQITGASTLDCRESMVSFPGCATMSLSNSTEELPAREKTWLSPMELFAIVQPAKSTPLAGPSIRFPETELS
jgi:hypothetical protein